VARFRSPLLGALFLLSICAAQARLGTSTRITRQRFTAQLVAAAVERAHHVVRYLPDYVHIDYPNGDVPASTGVCADEIIRVYRAVGVDLQKEIHEDMVRHFAEYPRKWRMTRTDTNIDHRRVPNLMVFFERKGAALPVTVSAQDYLPGDIVSWELGGNVPHIGIVVGIVAGIVIDRHPLWSSRNLVLHNVGEGPKIEDVLFRWQITGHYRYYGPALEPDNL
jgi:uncharacterized protein YijF (DUF1287 family)